MASDIDTETSLRLPLPALLVVTATLVMSSDLLSIVLVPVAGSAAVQASYLALYALALVLALRSHAVVAFVRRCPLMVPLVLLPLASTYWSIDRSETFERAIGVLGTSILGGFAGWYLGIERLVRLVAWGLLINALASALAIIAVPSIGIGSEAPFIGAWLGIHNHKNELGGSMSLAVLALGYASLDARGGLRALFLAGLALSVVLLVGSASATALVVTIAGVVVMAAFILRARAPRLGLLVGLSALVVTPLLAWIAVEIDLADRVLVAFDKNVTLHSRMEIWRLVWPYVEERYWLGYGYGVFWQPDLPWMDQLSARLRFEPFYAHNGIVETWIGGGLVTVSLVVLVFVATMAKSLVWAVIDRQREQASFALVFIVTFALRNVTEASLLSRNNLFWTLFVAVAAASTRRVRLRLGGDAASDAPLYGGEARG